MNTKLLDWTTALESVANDPELLTDIVQTAIDQLPLLLNQLKSTYDSKDLDGATLAAHTIQGSLRIFGKSKARESAEEIERLLQQSTSNSICEKINALQSALSDVIEELKNHR